MIQLLILLAPLASHANGAPPQSRDSTGSGFEESFRLEDIPTLLDTALVDIDGDGRLDLYTANHSRLQSVLLNRGSWKFEDGYAALELHQDRAHPGLEGEPTRVEVEADSLCIYWLGKDFVIESRELSAPESYAATLSFYGSVRVAANSGFEVSSESSPIAGDAVRSKVHFLPPESGSLRLDPEGIAAPFLLRFDEVSQQRHVRVGRSASQTSDQEMEFSLRDRHGHAWSDVDDDGRLDVLIARGGMGGHSDRYPLEFTDELLLRRETGFRDAAGDFGLVKRNNRARRSSWCDANLDGVLDLFVTSHQAPLQLFLRQGNEFQAADESWGLAAIEHPYVLAADLFGDASPELVVSDTDAVLVLAQREGRYETQQRFPVDSTPGRGVLADYDGDGDRDLLAVTKQGLVLLRNLGASMERIDPTPLGLPGRAEWAEWVDYDNDGDLDLFALPGGLYRQEDPTHFEQVADPHVGNPTKPRAAWADLNNDGTRDLVLSSRSPRKLTWQIEVRSNRHHENDWLQVQLRGPEGNREAVGAAIRLESSGATQTRWVGEAEGSLYCQGHYRVYFGLGPSASSSNLTLLWPDGTQQVLEGVAPNQRLEIAYAPTGR